MDIGMLWYDDSPLALKDRINRAAGYYSEKHGRKPNLCFVHPNMLKDEEGKAEGVMIRKDKGIMPGHFWIGVDESQIKKNGNGKKASDQSNLADPSESASAEKSAGAPTWKAASKSAPEATESSTTVDAPAPQQKASKKSKAKGAGPAQPKATATAKPKAATPKPKAATAKTKAATAKTKAATAKTKAATAKPKTATATPKRASKEPEAAAAEPVKRKPALLKKKGSRVKTTTGSTASP